MANLPAHPHLGQLRHQAKDLLRAAQAGDSAALSRIEAVSDRLTLAAAQLALARENGFPSWSRLKDEIDARRQEISEEARQFIEASIRGRMGRAWRLLADTPEIAGYNFATAVVLGNAARVREELEREPAQATRPDADSGWTALHAVCGSRWHRVDAAHAEGLLEVAGLLLDCGADPNATIGGQPGGRSALECATATASGGAVNFALIEMLLQRGAIVGDHDLYLAGFAGDDHECLRLLIAHTPDVAEIAEMALAAPISADDVEGLRILLEAGADPPRYCNDEHQPCSVVWDAVSCGCSAEALELLLAHGADPNAPGPDGRSAYRQATARAQVELVELLRRHGAEDDATQADRFLMACLRADRDQARRCLSERPRLLDELTDAERGAIVEAAEVGNTRAVELMLELGIPIQVQGGDHGASALHAAAYSGCVETVRLLLDHGADIEATDRTWGDAPLDWAVIGSGDQPGRSPAPDWIAIVQTLIDAGASTQTISLTPDDPKPPSPEVAQLLRERGIGGGER
ncbi:MAG TPA: ankyrin repeat domain-containing protein [Solirubrobacteraceae bacterium]